MVSPIMLLVFVLIVGRILDTVGDMRDPNNAYYPDEKSVPDSPLSRYGYAGITVMGVAWIVILFALYFLTWPKINSVWPGYYPDPGQMIDRFTGVR
jgi:hypothetical protein